jgi:RNase adapter protein RapZ
MSFGFKHGVPNDADFVIDVRCLPNPHWQPELRDLTGRDEPVIRFLEAAPVVRELKLDVIAFLDKWIATFDAEGRSYLTIAFGCTGGRHRSVYMAESVAPHFANGKRNVSVRHRENP